MDPSIFTFINHGCNGTNNVGTKLQLTEATIEVDSELEGIYDQASDEFHPFNERHFPSWKCGDLVAREDIHPGDELFDNYLVFGGVSGWEENLQELKYICSGRKIGTVSQYEQS